MISSVLVPLLKHYRPPDELPLKHSYTSTTLQEIYANIRTQVINSASGMFHVKRNPFKLKKIEEH